MSYSMNEVCRMLALLSSTIRYYGTESVHQNAET